MSTWISAINDNWLVAAIAIGGILFLIVVGKIRKARNRRRARQASDGRSALESYLHRELRPYREELLPRRPKRRDDE